MKKVFLPFLLLLALSLTNCSTKHTNCNEGHFYFPFPEKQNAEVGLDTLINEWYSSHLKSMNEPILTCNDECQTIRVTYLGTWSNPETYRIDKCQGTIIGTYKKSNGMGGYETGVVIEKSQKTISINNWSSLSDAFTKLKSTRSSNETSLGTDGSQWIIERRTASKYEYIDRWSIELTNNDKELFEYCSAIMSLIAD